MKTISLFGFIALFVAQAFAQSVSFEVNTGALIEDDMNRNFGGTFSNFFQFNIADRVGVAQLMGVRQSTVYGTNAQGMSGASVTISGVSLGYSISFDYFVDNEGKIILHYRVVTGTGVIDSNVETGLRSFIFTSSGSPSGGSADGANPTRNGAVGGRYEPVRLEGTTSCWENINGIWVMHVVGWSRTYYVWIFEGTAPNGKKLDF
jgi:hypothetical protein